MDQINNVNVVAHCSYLIEDGLVNIAVSQGAQTFALEKDRMIALYIGTC